MNNNDNNLNEVDYLNDEGYMEYKANFYKKKRISDIIFFISFIISIILLIVGIVFNVLNNGISTVFFIIGVDLIILDIIYFSIMRIMGNDDVVYLSYKKRKK